MRRVEITAAGLARPDLGQWAGLGPERLEADPAQPPTVPGIGVGVADPPRALGWARAVPAVAVSHGAALIRTPAPLEHRGFAGGQPLLDVGRGPVRATRLRAGRRGNPSPRSAALWSAGPRDAAGSAGARCPTHRPASQHPSTTSAAAPASPPAANGRGRSPPPRGRTPDSPQVPAGLTVAVD